MLSALLAEFLFSLGLDILVSNKVLEISSGNPAEEMQDCFTQTDPHPDNLVSVKNILENAILSALDAFNSSRTYL